MFHIDIPNKNRPTKFPIGGEAFGENQNITIVCTRTAKNAARSSLCSLLPVM
jgi:hypothetical protein